MKYAQNVIIMGAILVLGLAWVLYFRHGLRATLLQENASLRQELAQLEQERDEPGEAVIAPEERQRLLAAEQEMLRLRGEVTRLMQQKHRPWVPTNQVEKSGAQENVKPKISGFKRLQTAARAQLAQRQTLAIGGWPAHPGHRLLLLATPTIVGENSDQVHLDVYAIEAPETFLNRFGMSALVAADGVTATQVVISDEQRAGFQSALNQLFGSKQDAGQNGESFAHSYQFQPLTTSNGLPISIQQPLVVYRGWNIGWDGNEPAVGAPYLAGRFDLGPYPGAPIILAPSIMSDNSSIDLSVDATIFSHPENQE